jgi:uncharacterized NAD-dependent epimerase/dehydratase family protein
LRSIGEVIEETLRLGQLTNPAIRCVGISVNTLAIPGDERAAYLVALSDRYGLPCVDPMVNGTAAIVAQL